MDNNYLNYRREERTVYDLLRDIDTGRFVNYSQGVAPSFTSIDIVTNVILNVPFKPIVAQQTNDGKYLIQSDVLAILNKQLMKLRDGEQVGEYTKENVPQIEDFKFEVIAIRPSQSDFDVSRIHRY